MCVCVTCGKNGVGVERKKRHLSKRSKRESISDMWEKRGATYGEKGVCLRISKRIKRRLSKRSEERTVRSSCSSRMA